MTTDLATLLTPMTSEDVKRSIYSVIGKVGVDTTVWKPGAVVRTIIAAVSIILAALTVLVSYIAQSGFLLLAQGVWLTLVARYVFNVERELATFATGTLTLVNTGGGVFTYDAGDFSVQNPDTKKTYHNVEGFTLAASSTLTIDIIADEVGAGSTSLLGTIVTILATLSLVTCSNPTAAVGLDDELDPDLQVRCLDKLGSLSPNGPPDAYAFVARSALRADGTRIGVNRVAVDRDGYGNVYVTAATASGGVTGSSADPSTDLGALQLAIQTKCTPLGVTPWLRSAVGVMQGVTYTAYSYNVSGLTTAGIVAAANAALAQLFAKLPIGGHVLIAGIGFVYQDEMKAAITAAVPSVFHVVFSIPSADPLVPAGTVMTLGAVSGSAQLVARATL